MLGAYFILAVPAISAARYEHQLQVKPMTTGSKVLGSGVSVMVIAPYTAADSFLGMFKSRRPSICDRTCWLEKTVPLMAPAGHQDKPHLLEIMEDIISCLEGSIFMAIHKDCHCLSCA
jgi:hypothetical protein